MTRSRDDFLQRVRLAVAQGNAVGGAPPLPGRGEAGYQGGGDEPVRRFCEQVIAAGGKPYLAADRDAAAAQVLELLHTTAVRRVLLGRGGVLDGLDLARRLGERGLDVAVVDDIAPDALRDTFFQADVGISGVAWAIAETGTLVMKARPHDPRSLSLLPPVHIAVVERAQLLPDLFDLFADLEADKGQLPSCLSLITGPSKTGDIELKLVTGVHGPGQLHVVLI